MFLTEIFNNNIHIKKFKFSVEWNKKTKFSINENGLNNSIIQENASKFILNKKDLKNFEKN